MTEGIIFFLIVTCGIGIVFGFIYPLCALIFYPIYKALGGEKSFKKYMKGL